MESIPEDKLNPVEKPAIATIATMLPNGQTIPGSYLPVERYRLPVRY